jgi:hypothetical protein
MQRVLYRTTHRLIRAVDHAVLTRVLTPAPAARDPIEALTHAERMDALAAFGAFYDRPEHYGARSPFFTRAESIAPRQRAVRRYRRNGHVIDLSWPSNFEPMWSAAAFEELAAHAPAPLRKSIDTFQRSERRLGIGASYSAADPLNLTMRARWFRHDDGPRPCAVILHGYLGGRLALEEHMWPISTLFDRGMDVVLTVLPMHGDRATNRIRFRLPGFPTGDPRLTVEGFRHLVHDHLALFDYLLDGRVSALGLMGMSLGGYSAALLCTLDPRVRFSVFYMPLASIPELAQRTGRMVGTEAEQYEQTVALERVYRPVNPFARASLLAEGRALVITGEADLITGLVHGERIAQHFGAASSTYFGGHILALGKEAAFDSMWSLLRAEGLLRDDSKVARTPGG